MRVASELASEEEEEEIEEVHVGGGDVCGARSSEEERLAWQGTSQQSNSSVSTSNILPLNQPQVPLIPPPQDATTSGSPSNVSVLTAILQENNPSNINSQSGAESNLINPINTNLNIVSSSLNQSTESNNSPTITTLIQNVSNTLIQNNENNIQSISGSAQTNESNLNESPEIKCEMTLLGRNTSCCSRKSKSSVSSCKSVLNRSISSTSSASSEGSDYQMLDDCCASSSDSETYETTNQKLSKEGKFIILFSYEFYSLR